MQESVDQISIESIEERFRGQQVLANDGDEYNIPGKSE